MENKKKRDEKNERIDPDVLWEKKRAALGIKDEKKTNADIENDKTLSKEQKGIKMSMKNEEALVDSLFAGGLDDEAAPVK